jgi:ABC-type transport system involved in cytochrome c biogenesis ATPase subunit
MHREPPPPEALRFEFRARLSGFAAPHEIAFEFDPELMRLHRLMAIVGENGTGKTQLLARLAWALWGLQVDEDALIPKRPSIGRVIAVSYSALDDFKRPPHRMRGYEDRPVFDNYCYCGFRTPDDILEPGLLFDTLEEDLSEINRLNRRETWVRMLGELGLRHREPDFDAAVKTDDEAVVEAARHLAAGEKTALSVLTRLLAKLRNRSIVLFDEPETNLHPRLLAALLRVLHDWLDELDGYCVIATHSPIVLQEIPGRMVRVLTRDGRVPRLRPYAGECFGQNLSEIVVEVFGSGERDRNYATELEKLLSVMEPEAVEPTFGRTLSLGARMALRYLEEYGGDREEP